MTGNDHLNNDGLVRFRWELVVVEQVYLDADVSIRKIEN